MNRTAAFLTAAIAMMGVTMADAQETRPMPPMLVVTGNAQEMAAPDTATVRLGVVARGGTAAAAQSQASQIMTNLLGRLDSLKIDRKNVQTMNLSLQPVYYQPKPGEAQPEVPRIIGYQATQSVAVTFSDFALIGRVIDSGVAVGINNIEGVSFGLRNSREAQTKALRSAVAEARDKANAMADALGVAIIGVQDISENATVYPQPMYAPMAMDRGMGTPVEPGQVTISGTVTIRYLIRMK